MYLTSFLTWTIRLKKFPAVNAKVITEEEGGKETGKGKCRNGNMRLGQQPSRREKQKQLVGWGQEKMFYGKIQKEKVARTWDSGEQSIKGRNVLIWECNF